MWKPTADAPIHWQWQLSQPFNISTDLIPGVTVYDIDWEQNSASVVAALHAKGFKVIAYLEAGDWTFGRADAGQFPAAVIGNTIPGWTDRWLDIRSDAVRTIMAARLDSIKAKGFDAVEPDCIDGYSNSSGFPLTYADQLNYNEWIAAQCHARGLSVGLKGDNDQVGDLYTYFDWALNEECNRYNECFASPNSYSLFVNAGKAVFNVEYRSQDVTEAKCATMSNAHVNSMRRNLDLTAPGTSGYVRVPCIPDTQNTW